MSRRGASGPPGLELGHAMGLDHVAAGVMAPRVEDVAEVASAEDWREFCRANRCDSP